MKTAPRFKSEVYSKVSAAIAAVIVATTSAIAQSATCEVPLRNVLISEKDCAYYVTAFRMMATGKVSVEATCAKGVTSGPNGATYDAQVRTTMTVRDKACNSINSVSLNPVLLSKPNCENLKNTVAMLSTDYVSIEPICKFGKWSGADGTPRTSMVVTKLALRTKTAR